MNWKMRTVVSCLTVFTLICGAISADAAVVGQAVSASGNINLDAFNPDADGDTFPNTDLDGDTINESFSALGDMFGLGQRGLGGFGDPSLDNYPFALMDESLSIFTGDVQGIIKGGDVLNSVPFDDAPFFGVSDTVNGDTTTAQQATWDFDVSAASGGLSVSIDFAAMGNFEEPEDEFQIDFSFGGAFTPLFTRTIDEAGTLAYTLESGLVTDPTVDDPISVNGTQLNNEFQTITALVAGTGDTLTLRFSALSNGGTEAFAFRNIVVEDGAAPGGVAGDYNGNGVVDAADYTVWLDNLGSTTALANEDPLATTPGVVDQEDYDFWKTRFGAIVGTATGSSIPEPCSALLVLLAALQIGAIRRR